MSTSPTNLISDAVKVVVDSKKLGKEVSGMIIQTSKVIGGVAESVIKDLTKSS